MTTTAAEERGNPAHRPGPPLRRYTLASFDNLIVLANNEERLREARKMVWRDRGEPAVEVHDIWECLEHGLRGGLRASRPFCVFPDFELNVLFVSGAGTLAFAIRSGVNLILLLARIQRARTRTRNVSRLVRRVGARTPHVELIAFVQEDACFACTACALWRRFFPLRCHARFVTGS
jgi:hypothetical protein